MLSQTSGIFILFFFLFNAVTFSSLVTTIAFSSIACAITQGSAKDLPLTLSTKYL
jgi:hypothetical protein